MTTHLKRYEEGEAEAIWQEIETFGNMIPETLREDAWCIAQELVDRTISNLEALQNFLAESGYIFAASHPITFATDQTAQGVEEISAELGDMPLILKAWWQRIDTTDFSQDEEQYYSGSGQHCDGIVPVGSISILPPQEALILSRQLLSDCKKGNKMAAEFCEKENRPVDDYLLNQIDEGFLTLGPCASNNELKGFSLPCSALDTRYYNDGGGDMTLADDFRRLQHDGGLQFYFTGTVGGEIAVRKTSEAKRNEVLSTLLKEMKPV